MHDDRLQQKAALEPHYDIVKLAFYAGLCVDARVRDLASDKVVQLDG